MKRLILMCWFVGLSGALPLTAQTFSKSYDVDGRNDIGWASEITPLGLLVATGSFCSDGSRCNGIFLLDPTDGKIIWKTVINPIGVESHSTGQLCMVLNADSTFMLAGNAWDQAANEWFFLYKMSLASGDILWERQYPADVKGSNAIVHQPDGGYILCVSTFPPGSTKSFATLMRVDEDGNFISSALYGEPFGNRPFSLQDDALGGYALLRNQFKTTIYDRLPVILERLSSDGTVLWSNTIDTVSSTTYAQGHALPLRDGGIAVGYAKYHNHFPLPIETRPPYVAKYDSLGNLVWEWIRYGTVAQRRQVLSLLELPDGDLVGVGWYEEGSSPVYTAGWMFRLSPEGMLRWERLYHRVGHDYRLYSVNLDSEGSLIATGEVDTTGMVSNTGDIWVLKTDSEGCLHPGCTEVWNTTVAASEPAAPEDGGGVLSIQPNPASSQVHLSWPLLAASPDVRLLVADVFGRQAAEVRLAAGETTHVLDLSGFATGLYFVTVTDKGKPIHKGKFIVQH